MVRPCSLSFFRRLTSSFVANGNPGLFHEFMENICTRITNLGVDYTHPTEASDVMADVALNLTALITRRCYYINFLMQEVEVLRDELLKVHPEAD